MVLVSNIQHTKEAVCACCFRTFRLDERGRLYPHVYTLGMKERCHGYRFPPAGESLEGSRWQLDKLVHELRNLQEEHLVLQQRPLLGGTGPFSDIYEALWYQKTHHAELRIKCLTLEVDRLTATIKEWQPGEPIPGPTRVHLQALWKLRAGTAVPLCFSEAPQRPAGDPILVVTNDLVDCPVCVTGMKNSSIIPG